MSASGSVTEKVEPKFSPKDFPELPGAVPKVVASIDQLHSAILATQKITVAHSRERELRNQVRLLTDLFTTLHKVAGDVTKSAAPFFETGKANGPWNSKGAQQQARQEAMEKLKELDRVLREQVDAQVTFPEVSVTPNFLPRVESLSSELKKLSGSLQGVMSSALDPRKKTDVAALKDQLEAHRSQFEDLGAQAGNLKEPVSQRADALDKFIEDTRENMATIWISKAVCDWQLARIDIFANCYSNLEELQQTIAGVTQENEDLKTFLRKNPFTPLDTIKLKFEQILQEPGESSIKEIASDINALLDLYPESASSKAKDSLKELLAGKPETKISAATDRIKAVLAKLPQSPVDEAKRHFDSVRRRYNECKELAEQYRPAAEKAIKDLEVMLAKGEKILLSSIEEIPFHDDEVRSNVLKQMQSSISEIQGQRETLLYKIRELWSQIHSQFTVDSYDHLFYEINREGYAIFEYGGRVPRDTTYGYFWSVSNRYVTALTVEENK